MSYAGMGREEDTEFFTRLNTRSIGRGEPNPKKWYEEEEDRWKNPLRKWQLPLGHFKLEDRQWYTPYRKVHWIANFNRINRLMKRIQGPLQKDDNKRWRDQTGTRVLDLTERKVIMNHKNSQGKWITIYDTDEYKLVDKIYDNYNRRTDMQMMMTAIENVEGTNKRNINEFINMVYEPDKKLKREK